MQLGDTETKETEDDKTEDKEQLKDSNASSDDDSDSDNESSTDASGDESEKTDAEDTADDKKKVFIIINNYWCKIINTGLSVKVLMLYRLAVHNLSLFRVFRLDIFPIFHSNF